MIKRSFVAGLALAISTQVLKSMMQLAQPIKRGGTLEPGGVDVVAFTYCPFLGSADTVMKMISKLITSNQMATCRS